MNRNLGALELAAALVVVDVVLLLALIALWSLTKNVSDWLGGFVLIAGYRLASLQPLVLFALLRACRQELRSFSPSLTMLLALISSAVSLYSIGLLIAVLTGGGPKGEIIPIANDFVANLLLEHPLLDGPLPLLAALVYSPWLVLLLRTAWRRSKGHQSS